MKTLVHLLVVLSVVGMIGMVSVSLVPPPIYAGGDGGGGDGGGGGGGATSDPCPNPFDPITGEWIGWSTQDAAEEWGNGLGKEKFDVVIEEKDDNDESFDPPKFKKYDDIQVPEGPVKNCDPKKSAKPGPVGQTPTGTNVTP